MSMWMNGNKTVKKDHRFSREGRTLEADELALHTSN